MSGAFDLTNSALVMPVACRKCRCADRIDSSCRGPRNEAFTARSTIRPIVACFFATSRFTGLTPYEFFGTAFCIGFVLHLIAAEVWIHWSRPLTMTPPVGVSINC
jgi:hypothetical protein